MAQSTSKNEQPVGLHARKASGERERKKKKKSRKPEHKHKIAAVIGGSEKH